jgi:hypothetical protein
MSVKKIGEWKKKTGKEKTKWKQTLNRQYGTKCYNKVRYNDEDFCAQWKEIKDSDNSDSKRKLKERKEINNENWQRLHPNSKISKEKEEELKKRQKDCLKKKDPTDCQAKLNTEMINIMKKTYHPVYGWLAKKNKKTYHPMYGWLRY